ncbi:MAG: DEAD/DEAH box helicase family protein [Bacteroidetes bacterium]|nr:DEAD/DEAH box helicase family protein [Bacteroidota bacterium]
MPSTTINQLIVNSPYEEPTKHWHYDRQTRLFKLDDGRRSAGFVVASADSKAFDDPGVFKEIPLVNQIRSRVKAWRHAGYPGITGITRRLLNYWNDPEEFARRRFFFCQLEAAETLIWLREASPNEHVGLDIPSDGGMFDRLCAKMATGSGKTIVMAMVIAWHILNKVTYKQDPRFSKNILVVAPGLTVKNRLAVLKPTHEGNYYENFRVVPSPLLEKLRQGRIIVRNWHALNWETEEQIAKKRGVDKRGAQSDEAYVREVLGQMASARNLLIINDEAHHAWRIPRGAKVKGIGKNVVEEATKWVGGLDRIHKARGILKCYDFSATPFSPSGNQNRDDALFGWIISDFGLNDAIESGLVKTPRVVIHDDALPDIRTYKSRLYHIYYDPEVKDDLNRRAKPEEPLPDLVMNGYYLLGHDWRKTAKNWEKSSKNSTPPVMITVANRTETAARLKYAFDRKRIAIEELCDSERILHIDSTVLKKAESSEETIADLDFSQGNINPNRGGKGKRQAEFLRQQVDTVGQVGQPGEWIQNVISVGMLSEGWDAKTVTHIMGLRAFSSQLLCEQVVGRGLRRTSYEVNPETGLFEPEYVNIFGIPFTFLPHEGEADNPPPPPKPKTAIEPVPGREKFEISWPNVIRVEHTLRPELSVDWGKLSSLDLDATTIAKLAELAPIIEGKPDATKVKSIDLESYAKGQRMQRLVFEAARDVYDQVQPNWKGGKAALLAQLVHLVEKFINKSDRIRIASSSLDSLSDSYRKIVITLSMTKVVHHVLEVVRFQNIKKLDLVFDQDQPIRSSGDMSTWYTSRPCELTKRSHINYCVFDSTWEASDSGILDASPEVDAWVKNDHLGFEILYAYRGVIRKYRPDFIIRLRSGNMLILETKGEETGQTRTKHKFLQEWVKAVNAHGGHGHWSCAISRAPGELTEILRKHATR